MTERQNAAPVVQTGSGESGQLYLDEVLPDPQSTTVKPTVQAVSALLLRGEENAVPLRHLVRITGQDEREIRRQIHRERLKGVPILADCRSGYYLPAKISEKERCVKSLLRRAEEIRNAARAIEEAPI